MADSVGSVRRLLLCFFGAAVLIGCGDNSAPAPAAQSAATSATAAAANGSAAVPASLAFTAPKVGGGTVDLAGYAGKPVLLWFWAPT